MTPCCQAPVDVGRCGTPTPVLTPTPVFPQDGSYSFCAAPRPGEEPNAAEWRRSQDTRVQNQLPRPHQHPEGRRAEGHLHWVLGSQYGGRVQVGNSRSRPDTLTPSLPRLSAGLLRQATYTTTRLGIYTVLFERLTGADGTPPGFLLKALIGMTAGATGAFVGTPAEVALIRMTADGR